MKKPTSFEQGFTLAEVSIVLLIIALLVTVVTAGQSMIKSARLRSLVGQVDQYKAALSLFRMQYNAIPGDMSNATSYWPGTTKNGDGNRLIKWGATPVEDLYVWQHLSLARVLNINYTGEADSPLKKNGKYQNPKQRRPGINVPEAAIDHGAWAFYNQEKSGGYYKTLGNSLQLAALNGNFIDGGVLTALEAKTMDSKMDDGIANTGQLYTVQGSDVKKGYCVTRGAYSNKAVEYILTDKGPSCRVGFWMK